MKKTAILCLGAAILLSSLAVGCSGGSEAGGSIEFKTIKSGTTYRLLNSAREFGADGDTPTPCACSCLCALPEPTSPRCATAS